MFYSKHWGALTKRLNNEICLEESPQPFNRPRYSRILTLNNLCASLCMSLTVQADWIPLYFSLSSFQSFFFFLHREATERLKAKKASLIEYWSGIVRQAEMTKSTHENKPVICCAFSAVINSAVQLMYPSGGTSTVLSSVLCGELWSCGRSSSTVKHYTSQRGF